MPLPKYLNIERVDPKIRDLIILLNEIPFIQTFECCEGHLRVYEKSKLGEKLEKFKKLEAPPKVFKLVNKDGLGVLPLVEITPRVLTTKGDIQEGKIIAETDDTLYRLKLNLRISAISEAIIKAEM
ncbi:MAG: hypothetical protein QMD14_04150 [Candidatus Aenigmarchaeota archaeon]|nr:hypothetical protein [Candidatus Aenigmarchaeota archaeon]